MKLLPCKLDGLKLIEPSVYGDSRGYFLETWQYERYKEYGIYSTFVQDNLSCSNKGVLRGLHIQNPNAQGKLVQVIDGEIFDVAVDLRIGSPTYGMWESFILSGENKRQLYIPEGFAHGFCTLSDKAYLSYKCTTYYSPKDEITLLWNDPDIGIEWPKLDYTISDKDLDGLRLWV